MNVRTKGLVCGAVAAATYGMNPLFTLPLYHAGMTPDSVLFYRYAFALPILAVMIRLRGQDFSLRRCEMLPLVAMGLLFSASSLFLYMSYNYMDAGIASTILFVYPILVALIMALGFRERITPLTIFCIALAVLGIGLLYEGDGQTLSLTGVTLVLLSSLSYAVYIVGVNRSALAALRSTSCGSISSRACKPSRRGICGATCWRWRRCRRPFRCSAPRRPSTTSAPRRRPSSVRSNPSRRSSSAW